MKIIYMVQNGINEVTFAPIFDIIVFDENFNTYKFSLSLSISTLLFRFHDDPFYINEILKSEFKSKNYEEIDINISNFNEKILKFSERKVGVKTLLDNLRDRIKSNIKIFRRELYLNFLNSKKEEKNDIRSFCRGEISLDEINKKGIKFIKPI